MVCRLWAVPGIVAARRDHRGGWPMRRGSDKNIRGSICT